MTHLCGFCNQAMDQIGHTNSELFDIFLCEGCIRPDYDTRFRKLFTKDSNECLANTIRINDYFIVLNYKFTLVESKANYTKIYKKVIGEFNDQLDLKPLTMSVDTPVFDLDFILHLPLHDPGLALQKLQIYTAFS